MMELKKYKLGEIVSLSNGKKRPVSIGKYPVYGGNGIIDYTNMYNLDDGVIIGRVGAYCGVVHRSKEKCWVTDNAIAVSAKHQVDVDYLYYLMVAVDFHKRHIGAAQPLITQDIIENFDVKIPCMSMQKQVAAVLANIDRKIELNKAINANLEAMAKQLYDYWFVQFDFPDANGRPYKSSGGHMLYNPKLKRPIPAGWEVQELSNLADVRKGDMITSKETTEGKVKVVAGGISFAYYNGRSNRPSNTITVSGSGANAGYINFWREPIFASDCTTINFEDGLDTILCWYGIRLYQNVLFNYAIGAAQPHVYPNHVSSLPMVVIPVSIKEKVRDFFCSTNQQIRCNEQELDRLTALRDSLLPMLMNGQVSVL